LILASLGVRQAIEQADRLEQKRKQLQAEFEAQFRKDSDQLASLQQGCASNDPQAIRLLMSLSHVRHPLPSPLMLSFENGPRSNSANCTVHDSNSGLCNVANCEGEGRRIKAGRGVAIKVGRVAIKAGRRVVA